MKIKFLGATRTVTGSKHLLIGKRHNILIDCGLYQGPHSEKYNKEIHNILANENIHAIVLTHAHLDHCGYLPKLVKDGFNGPIFATAATRDLAKIIMQDNAHIQAEKVKHSGLSNAIALYQDIHVNQTLALFEVKEFNHRYRYEEFHIEFKKAGHILGASSPIISCEGKTIQFSGDLGRSDDLTMFPPEPAEKVDYLVIESTYGNRNHSQSDYLEELAQVVKSARDSDTTLVIPAFSVGRSQTLMLALYQLFDQNPKLELSVYVDSPMTQQVTQLYHNYLEQHKIPIEILKAIESKFKFVHYQSERDKMDLPGKKIILTASGMLSGGHILHHLENHGTNPDNIFLIVGFQSPDTIGYQLQTGNRTISLEDGPITIAAKIQTIDLFSSHADHNQLIQWAGNSGAKMIFITHGEEDAKQQLLKDLSEKLESSIFVPQLSDIIELN